MGVVKNEAVVLAGMNPQAPAHHLRIEPLGERRPQKRDAVNALRVEPLGVDIDVADRLEAALLESFGYAVPLRLGRQCCHRGRLDSVLTQLHRDVPAMIHVHAEEDDATSLLSGNVTHGRPDGLGYHVIRPDGAGQGADDVVSAVVALYLFQVGLNVSNLRPEAA